MTTTVLSKSLYNGGRKFIIYNTANKTYHIGHTSSTAVAWERSDIKIEDVLVREIKDIQRQLDNNGFEEYHVKWGDNFDTYQNIEATLFAERV